MKRKVAFETAGFGFCKKWNFILLIIAHWKEVLKHYLVHIFRNETKEKKFLTIYTIPVSNFWNFPLFTCPLLIFT